MKKVLASLLILFVLMIGIPLSAEAHANCPRHRKAKRSYATRTYRSYRTAGYSYRRPTFYQRHRDKVHLAIGTGAGALIGGLTKGRRGAGVGALIGLGGSALYTYVLRPKKRRY